MKTSTLKILADFSFRIGIPPTYVVGRAGGEVRILIAAATIDENVRAAACSLAEDRQILPDQYRLRPTIKRDPVGGTLAERPFLPLDEDESETTNFIMHWEEGGLDRALQRSLEKDFRNPIFVDYGLRLTLSTWKLMTRLVPMDVVDKDFLSDGSKGLKSQAFGWLAPFRYVQHASAERYRDLLAEQGAYVDVVDLIASLRSSIPESLHNSIPTQGLRTKPPDSRSKADLPTKLKRLLSPADLRRVEIADLIDAGEEITSELELPTFEEYLSALQRPYAAANEIGDKNYGPSDRQLYISTVPGPGGLGHNAFLEIAETVVERYRQHRDPDSAAILLCIFHFCRPENIRFLTAETDFIVRQNKSFPEQAPDPLLHEVASERFFLPAPRLLLEALATLAGVFRSEDQLNDYLKLTWPTLSLSRLRRYLLFNGCEYFRFGSTIPRCGFYAEIGRPDVARTYIHLTPPAFAGYVGWLRDFFPDFSIKLEDIPRSGSSRCAKVSVVREMLSILENLLSREIPRDEEEWETHYNAIVSLAHLIAVVFLGGVRNYSVDLHWFLLQPTGWIVSFEKQLFGFHLPKPSKQIINRFLAFKQRALWQLKATGVCTSELEQTIHAPAKFQKNTAEHSLRALPLCWASIRNALQSHPLTWEFSLLHRNALRHLSMTELTTSEDFYHHTVECFHQRSLHRLNPLCSGNFGDPLHRASRERCSAFLHRILIG